MHCNLVVVFEMSVLKASLFGILCGIFLCMWRTNALIRRSSMDILLYRNISMLNSALERMASTDASFNLTAYQQVINYILEEPLVDPLFEDEDFFKISIFLSYFYEKPIFLQLNYLEFKTLESILETLPSSYVNAALLKKPCIRTKLYRGEYLMVISDDQKHVVRAVTLNPDYRRLLKRSVFWSLVNFREKENLDNIVGLSNDAFQEHYHSSYLFNDYNEKNDKNEALLFIGLESPRPAYTSWKLHPQNNAFLIEDVLTGQYLCAGASEILIWKYRFVFAVKKDSETFNIDRCSWEMHNCDYERDTN